MTRHTFFPLLLACTPGLMAQQQLDFKGESYPATASWDFLCERYALAGKASFQVGKTSKGGLLQISVPTSDESFFIGGVVYVYLEDLSVIVCTDKNFRQRQQDNALAWYVFTEAEMARLKVSQIASIRFNIRGKQSNFSSQTGNFTAVNKKSYFSLRELKPETFPTEVQIAALYPNP